MLSDLVEPGSGLAAIRLAERVYFRSLSGADRRDDKYGALLSTGGYCFAAIIAHNDLKRHAQLI